VQPPPTTKPDTSATNPAPIPLKELAAILIRHYDHHEGFYEVGVQFNIAVGSVGPGPDPTLAAPGAVVAVAGIGLAKCSESSPLGVDASLVNPAVVKVKKPARKKAPKSVKA
jgi:hypothetical protein